MTKGKKMIALAICAAMAMSFAACDDSGKKEETDSFLGGLIGGTDSDGEKTSDGGKEMSEYEISSKVASADSTAKELNILMRNWMTDMDTKNTGMKMNSDNTLVVYMRFSDECRGGKNGDKFCSTSDIAGAYVQDIWEINTSECETGDDLENSLEDYVGGLTTDLKGSALFILCGGICRFTAFTPDSDGGTWSDMAAFDIQKLKVGYLNTPEVVLAGWESGTPGLGDDGKIYGTYPKA